MYCHKRKDHVTMYYISYSRIESALQFYSILHVTKGLLKYTRVTNAERFCSIVEQCWTHSPFLLRRKYEINVEMGFDVFPKNLLGIFS